MSAALLKLTSSCPFRHEPHVKVLVWKGNANSETVSRGVLKQDQPSFGHSVLEIHLGGAECRKIYISFWPGTCAQHYHLRPLLCQETESHFHTQEMDEAIESSNLGEANAAQMALDGDHPVVRRPKETILEKLDIPKMIAKLESILARPLEWHHQGGSLFWRRSYQTNCAHFSLTLLDQGGLWNLIEEKDRLIVRASSYNYLYFAAFAGVILINAIVFVNPAKDPSETASKVERYSQGYAKFDSLVRDIQPVLEDVSIFCRDIQPVLPNPSTERALSNDLENLSEFWSLTYQGWNILNPAAQRVLNSTSHILRRNVYLGYWATSFGAAFFLSQIHHTTVTTYATTATPARVQRLARLAMRTEKTMRNEGLALAELRKRWAQKNEKAEKARNNRFLVSGLFCVTLVGLAVKGVQHVMKLKK